MIDRNYRPRLADLCPLVASDAPALLTQACMSSPASLADRAGYRADHLGAFVVPLPTRPPASRCRLRGATMRGSTMSISRS